ncbi:Diacylglycerol pyrophosphate phosphatase 1 [Spathaspora sp. JA1]|nr:Diacylglycerol pyrophosphate phosphatase 1 [Spathaspora sp. JA1]
MQLYFTSEKFKQFIPDWIVVFILITVFFQVTEVAQPFYRQFSINDPTISHPFATTERVTDNELYVYSTILPTLIITIMSLSRGTGVPHSNTFFDKLHLSQVSCLGLWFSVCVTSVITDILKCWIANPRPDFLARCGAAANTPVDKLVGIEVCTAPLGNMYLSDGMKSTPSGHSSMAFAGLLYLSLWLLGQFEMLKKKRQITLVHWVIVVLPLLVASYIGLSRTQDYRHHFFDIILGGLIGVTFACLSYFKYFNWLSDESCNLPIDYEK